MNRRGTGVVFLSISAFLHAMRYLYAAILAAGSAIDFGFSRVLGEIVEKSVQDVLLLPSTLFLLLGCIYLVWAEISEYYSHHKESMGLVDRIMQNKK